MLGAWVPGARESQRIDHAAHWHAWSAAAFELGIEEAKVEAGVMRHEWRVLDEIEQLSGLVGEQRLVRSGSVGWAMDPLGPERHLPLGGETSGIGTAGLDP